MVASTARATGTTTVPDRPATTGPDRPTARGMVTPTAATADVPPAAATATAAADVPATPSEPHDRPADRVWVKQPICTCPTDLLPLPYLVLSTTAELDAHFQSTWDIREQDKWNVSQPQTITGTPSDEPSEGEPTERSYSGRQGTCSPCELDRQCGGWHRYVRKLWPIEVRLSRYVFCAASSLIVLRRYGAGTNPFSKPQQPQNPEQPFFSI